MTVPRRRRIWQRVLGTALLMLGLALGADLLGPNWIAGLGPTIQIAIAITTSFTGVWFWFSSSNSERADWIRLDWFLPMIRRASSNRPRMHSWLAIKLRSVVPQWLQSNWETKQRGFVRRVLRKLGPSWIASPLRRISQTTCLLLFLWLFFYCCWPYDAKPSAPMKVGGQWRLIAFVQDDGSFRFQSSRSPNDTPPLTTLLKDKISHSVYVAFRPAQGANAPDLLGQFSIGEIKEPEILLQPIDELTPRMLNLITSDLTELAPFEFYLTDPTAWPDHYATNLQKKQFLAVESFLLIDPLVSLSTAIAARSWVWSLACGAAILVVCVVIPRGFCGYLCPLGTTIDLFDWLISRRTERFRVPSEGWWVHTKYYLLGAILVAATCGVLISGLFSAIPVITRGLLFALEPVQSGTLRGWHLVPSLNWGHAISLALFFAVLFLGFMQPRFWCKYVCPSGAMFSIGNLFRITERKVESSCIHCNKCVEICPFDAIKPDFTTRATDCTLCQSCGGVCPTHAIKFVERGNLVELKLNDDPPTNETALGRRGFLSLAAGSTAATLGGVSVAAATKVWGAGLDQPDAVLPIRPPGSVPEQEFLQMCIRCGECFKVCPNNVLQPESFEQGLEGLWTPMVNADWAGCESSCNACGQACPTGAIRALPLEEKRVARMGLAVVNEATCLPVVGKEECDLCVKECTAAGYNAIEYTSVGVEVDDLGIPIEGTGFSAPLVLADKCVGCGLCQTRCYAINVKDRKLFSDSAIVIEAGEGKEDRIQHGSYIALRESEKSQTKNADSHRHERADNKTSPVDNISTDTDPFGVQSDSTNKTPDKAHDDGAPTSKDPFGVGDSGSASVESPF